MSDEAAIHEKAAVRHELAAESHQRAARFWDDQGDRERTELQRTLAEYELIGAELERHWAELVQPKAAKRRTNITEPTIAHTRESAKRLSLTLRETARALEKSAALAEVHAGRWEKAGKSDDAAAERQAAKRAYQAAQRAHSQAEEWLQMTENPKR